MASISKREFKLSDILCKALGDKKIVAHKCYNCGKEISSDSNINQLFITIRKKTYLVCSKNCKRSISNFLGLLIADF